jgi:hypothetical protein
MNAKTCMRAGAWLVLGLCLGSGCERPVPGQSSKTKSSSKAEAGAPATEKASSSKKTSDEEDTAAAGKGGDAAKSSGRAGSGSSTSSGSSMAGGAAGRAASPPAAGGPARSTTNPRAIPACEGKVDEYACDDVMLYHCVDGAYEGRAQACDTSAQCQAGLTTGQCGQCDPGTFQCLDVELQSCDATGAWVLSMECASAKLCKADMGICDVQVCGQDELKCNGDQLQTCNSDFSDFMDIGAACEPGLCSAAAQGCLECMPGAATACSDDSTLTGCTAEGMLDPQPCARETPFCVADKCVQCTTASDCGESMNDCGTLTCTDGACVAGSPKPKGTACSSNGGEMCDYLGSCVVCVTDLDCNDSTKRCFLQSRCVSKDAIAATPLITTWSVTISPGFKAQVFPDPGLTVRGTDGGDLTASQTLDRTYLISIGEGYTPCGLPKTAPKENNEITLGFSLDANTMGGGFPNCSDASIRLVAKTN